jgi:hypothetical protein
MDARELIASVCPLVRDAGWAHFFAPATIAKGADFGLDPQTFYFMGRGGVLGDVEWQAVHSAFGYFNPVVVQAAWEAGLGKIAPRHAGRLYIDCCQELGRAKLAGTDGLEAFCEAAGAVNDAADVPGSALYAATAAEPLAEDPPARAMQLATVLREFRGGAHLVALVASGLTPLQAHYLHRPEAMPLFGWTDADVPEVGEDDHARFEASERLTDEIVLPAYSVLDDAGAAALLAGAEAIQATVWAF